MCHFCLKIFFLTNHGWRSDGAQILSASCLARQKAPVKSWDQNTPWKKISWAMCHFFFEVKNFMGGVSRMGLKLCQHRFQHVSLPLTNFYEKRPPGTPKFLVIFDQIAMCHFWPDQLFFDLLQTCSNFDEILSGGLSCAETAEYCYPHSRRIFCEKIWRVFFENFGLRNPSKNH